MHENAGGGHATLGTRPVSPQREAAALPKRQTFDVMRVWMMSVVRRAIFNISFSLGEYLGDMVDRLRE